MKLFALNAPRHEVTGTFAAVATSHWIATQVAMGVLERGGNAFDAAAAAGFVHQVVEPHQCGPGGEVVIQAIPAGATAPTVICGQGTAPDDATPERYRSMGLDIMPSLGLLAACVPGAVGGWLAMAAEYGTMDVADILEPAIFYASEGFPVYPRFLAVVRKGLRLFREEWASSAAVYLPSGRVPRAGDIFRNAELAETFRSLVGSGRSAANRNASYKAAIRSFYSGRIAETIGAFCADNEVVCDDGERRPGLLSATDMDRWRPSFEPTVSVEYGGFEIHKPGPWSCGPVMLQCLNILKGFDLADTDPCNERFVHFVTEACKLAYADREAFYGDSGDIPAPLGILLSEDYAAGRRSLISERASPNIEPGSIPGWSTPEPPREGSPRQRPREASMAALGAGDTCHVDIIDRWGNMVSATPSGGWLNDNPIIPTLGFPLGTRAQMFWLHNGSPSSLRPARRPRTTLSPTSAFRDGKPSMVFGARGSDMQEQWILQFFLRYIHCGLTLQGAIDALPFHSSHWHASIHPRNAEPMKLTLDNGFHPEVEQALAARGHEIRIAPDHEWNHSSAAEKSGPLLAAVSRGRIREAAAAAR